MLNAANATAKHLTCDVKEGLTQKVLSCVLGEMRGDMLWYRLLIFAAFNISNVLSKGTSKHLHFKMYEAGKKNKHRGNGQGRVNNDKLPIIAESYSNLIYPGQKKYWHLSPPTGTLMEEFHPYPENVNPCRT